MDESIWIGLGLVVGVALLYVGSRLRSRARTAPRPGRPEGDGSA